MPNTIRKDACVVACLFLVFIAAPAFADTADAQACLETANQLNQNYANTNTQSNSYQAYCTYDSRCPDGSANALFVEQFSLACTIDPTGCITFQRCVFASGSGGGNGGGGTGGGNGNGSGGTSYFNLNPFENGGFADNGFGSDGSFGFDSNFGFDSSSFGLDSGSDGFDSFGMDLSSSFDTTTGDACMIGDPCNPANGDQYEVGRDYHSLNRSVSVTRYYNSALTGTDFGLGYGWTASFAPSLTFNATTNPTQLLDQRPSGYSELFNKAADGSWQGPPDTKVSVVEDAQGYTLRFLSGAVERYDMSGRIVSGTTPNGQTTTFAYDTNGKLASITGPFGHQLTLMYNAGGHLASIADPSGATFAYRYDGANNLVGVTYPDGTTRTYLYENTSFPHALTGIVDGKGNRYATFTYDASGRSIANQRAITDNGAPQQRFSFQYDSDTQTTVTDAAGNHRVLQFASNLGAKNLVQVTNQDGAVLTRHYDSQNNLVSWTNEAGEKTAYTYNAMHERLSRTKAVGTGQSRTTTYQYLSDTVSLPTLITSPSVAPGEQRQIQIQYDANHNPAKITVSGFTPSGQTVSRTLSFTYNTAGELTSVDGPRTDVNDLITFSYYDCTSGGACGHVKRVTNALGQVTSFDTYDPNGHLLQMTDPNGLVTHFAYDARGRLVQVTQQAAQGPAHTTSYTYDADGQLAQSVGPDGLTLNYTYDATHALRTISNNLGETVQYTYDIRGNRTGVTLVGANGSPDRAWTMAYDLRNYVAQINNAGSVTSLVHDAIGNLITETDPNNDPTTTHHYDALNRLIQTIDRMGNPMAVSYDVNDHPTEVQAPNGATTTYAYDDLGDLLQEQSPDRGTLTYTYDAAGNALTQTDARGVIATYTYDALNRPLTVTYTSPPGGNLLVGWFRDLLERWHHLWGHKPDLRDPSTAVFSDDVTYTYDTCANGVGRLCGIQDQSGVTLKAYDAFGNLLQETRNTLGRTYITQYTYDAGNRIQTETYPSGRTVTYTRDPVGRVTAIHTDINGTDTAVLSNITYRADGLPVNETFGNGIQDSRSYDTQGRLLTQYLGVDTRVYSYDANGNETSLQTLPQVYRYTYDPLDRLVQDVIGNHSTDLTYDPNGNRLAQATSTMTIPYAYTPNSNRLIRVGNDTMTLDAAGNTISDHNGQRTFTYSPANRLFQVYTDRHLTAVYLYNAQSQRTAKVTDQGITLYHYDTNGNLLTETTDQGKTIRDYVYLNSVPVAQIDNHGKHEDHGEDHTSWGQQDEHGHHDRILYLHTDALGTPRLATDQNQTLVWRWEGSAFGNGQPVTGEALRRDERPHETRRGDAGGRGFREHGDAEAVTINLRFPGQYYDRETGLLYNWHRYYEPRVGRYISSDPIGLRVGPNPYIYANNNTLRWADYYGLWDSTTQGIINSLLIDAGAATLLIICPECEAGALIVEVGGQVLDAGHIYYEGREAIITSQEQLQNACP